MLTTVEGTYQDGVVRLDEPAPPGGPPVRKVLITFLEPAPATNAFSEEGPKNDRVADLIASWKQARIVLTGMVGSSLSDEVLAERHEEE